MHDSQIEFSISNHIVFYRNSHHQLRNNNIKMRTLKKIYTQDKNKAFMANYNKNDMQQFNLPSLTEKDILQTHQKDNQNNNSIFLRSQQALVWIRKDFHHFLNKKNIKQHTRNRALKSERKPPQNRVIDSRQQKLRKNRLNDFFNKKNRSHTLDSIRIHSSSRKEQQQQQIVIKPKQEQNQFLQIQTIEVEQLKQQSRNTASIVKTRPKLRTKAKSNQDESFFTNRRFSQKIRVNKYYSEGLSMRAPDKNTHNLSQDAPLQNTHFITNTFSDIGPW